MRGKGGNYSKFPSGKEESQARIVLRGVNPQKKKISNTRKERGRAKKGFQTAIRGFRPDVSIHSEAICVAKIVPKP